MEKSKEFYTVKKAFTIYALITEDDGDTLAFIGKTSSRDLNAVLRRHLRGEVSWTKRDFSKGASSGEPRLVPLEHIECTGAKAYQRLLCWYRILDEMGGIMVTNPPSTDLQAYNMSSDTEKIYRTILATTSVDDILSGKKEPTRFSPKKPSESFTFKRKRTQINIRVEENDRDIFYHLCRANHMSQREGFSHLLTFSPLVSDVAKQSAIDRLLQEKNEKIIRQTQAIADLERKLANKSRGQAADEKLKDALRRTNRLTQEYVELVIPHPEGEPLRCLSFNEWNRTYGAFSSYSYPAAAGHAVIQLKSIAYGKGTVPAIFLFGRNVATNELIKLRYYSTRYAVGFPPKNKYAFPDALFLASYAPTSDGAMGITFLLPLPAESSLPQVPTAVDKNIPFLDDVIAEIERNKCDLETSDSVY